MAKMSLKFNKDLLVYALFVYIINLLLIGYVWTILPATITGLGLIGLTLGGFLGVLVSLYLAAMAKDKLVK